MPASLLYQASILKEYSLALVSFETLNGISLSGKLLIQP